VDVDTDYVKVLIFPDFFFDNFPDFSPFSSSSFPISRCELFRLVKSQLSHGLCPPLKGNIIAN